MALSILHLMQYTSIRLQPFEKTMVSGHFLGLSPDDRRLRFGISLTDEGVHRHADQIDMTRDAVFAVLAPNDDAIGLVHLARGYGYAELGLSVWPSHRRRGIGATLFALASTQCRDWHIDELFIHYFADNLGMERLAQKYGVRTISTHGEVDGCLTIAAPEDRLSHADQPKALLSPESLAVVAAG